MHDETQAQGADVTPVETETVAAPASEADVQTVTTPEAAEAQETTVEATETVEEKLYAGKYKSPEELEKAYLSAQSEASRISQEKAELSKILADAFSGEAAVQTPVTPSYEDFEESAPAKPDDTVSRKVAVMEFAMSNPDANGAAMMEVLKTDPLIAQINGYEAKLKYAYAISQNSAKSKVVEQAVKQAQAATQTKIAEKQAAQVESASRQSPPTKEEPLTQDELRQALRDPAAFNKLLKERPGFKNYLG